MSKRNPMQPVLIAADGVVRFKQNKIVNDMLEFCRSHGFGLNEIAMRDYEKDDRSQLMQLIGYSVSGYRSLGCSRARHVMRADEKAEAMIAEVKP
jgi:hypothetical protein